MIRKSVLREAQEVQLAVTLIGLGARLQFLEQEVGLSRERLVRLYKEIKGVSPPKGLLPFSADWYMTWLANIHASMFYNIYRFRAQHADSELDGLVDAYKMYLSHVEVQGSEAVLDFTRAYTLVRYLSSKILETTACVRCKGNFVTHAYEGNPHYVCVLCRPPSRAGKPRQSKPFSDLVARAPAAAAAGVGDARAAGNPGVH